MESHVDEKPCSKRQEGWISGFFRRKKRSSSQEVDDNEHNTSEDSRVMRRHKPKNLHLSLSEITRKLKHAILKEKPRHGQRLLERKKSFQKSFSAKDHFLLERMTSISQYRSHQRRVESLSPGRIWDQSSTVLLRSSSEDFIMSETIAECSSPFISKSNQIVVDEMSKGEAYHDEERGCETLEETLSHLSVAASPSQPPFIEYDINLASGGEAKIPPLCKQLQEKTRPMDGKESVFKYVKAVLDAIESNWEELYLKTEFSDQLLYPALISNIPFYPNALCVDHELLFDCINEVLFEFCRFPQWVEPRTQALALSVESIVSEVQEKVYCHLLPMQLPRLLEEIVREDMAKPRSWLDTRSEIECIGFETSELILNELVEEVMVDLCRDRR